MTLRCATVILAMGAAFVTAQTVLHKPGASIPGPVCNATPSDGQTLVWYTALVCWHPAAGGAGTFFADAETPSGSIAGSNAAFGFTHTPAGVSLILARNGLIQKAGLDYTLTGAGVTFASASTPQSGDTLQAWYRW